MLVRFNFDTDYLGVQEEEIKEYPDETPVDTILDELDAWKDERASFWAEVVDKDGEIIRDL